MSRICPCPLMPRCAESERLSNCCGSFAWQVPLRPHIGTMAVMPANTNNYLRGTPGAAGANTIPPSKFGGNVDDWRMGKGGTMYYKVEVEGANLVVGDTHAAQGDSELAGARLGRFYRRAWILLLLLSFSLKYSRLTVRSCP